MKNTTFDKFFWWIYYSYINTVVGCPIKKKLQKGQSTLSFSKAENKNDKRLFEEIATNSNIFFLIAKSGHFQTERIMFYQMYDTGWSGLSEFVAKKYIFYKYRELGSRGLNRPPLPLPLGTGGALFFPPPGVWFSLSFSSLKKKQAGFSKMCL